MILGTLELKPIVKIVLGFDFGLKRIGVAVGQMITGTATPLPLLPARDGAPDWQKVKALIDEWQPQILLVGLPLNMDDTEQETTHLAKRFGNRLNGRFNLPVEWVDERLSSVEAEAILLETKTTAGRTQMNIDSLSAKIIVEQWFEQLKKDNS